jgi:hypothetical protein
VSNRNLDPWRIVTLWQRYDGEIRAAVLRVVAVAVMYGCQLAVMQMSTPDDALKEFHRKATFACGAWLLATLAAMVAIQAKIFVRITPYLSTLADLFLLTLVAAIGSKSQSPVVVGYFLIVLIAAQRFDLALLWMATLGSMACYLGLVGMLDKSWFDEVHATPVIQQLVMLTAIGMSGVMAGQLIRRSKALAMDYHQRVVAQGGK